MVAPLLLGIDIGALAAAVVVVDTNGRVMARAIQEFAPPAISDSVLVYSKEAPDDWWKRCARACTKSSQHLLPKDTQRAALLQDQ